MAISTISGLLVLSLGYTIFTWSLHRYRVWRNAGVWCALGSPEEGWQFGYGEEECPEPSESRIQSLNYTQTAQQSLDTKGRPE
ncbi:MAG: hypothetical protein AAFP00_01090 [Bacteroidota bacterium]